MVSNIWEHAQDEIARVVKYSIGANIIALGYLAEA